MITWMVVFWISVVAGVVGAIAMLEAAHQRRHPEQHSRRPRSEPAGRRVLPRSGRRRSS
jgi:hypothetical protein